MSTIPSAQLSISSSRIDAECKTTIEILRSFNLPASVTPNKSISPYNSQMENGCRIKFSEAPYRDQLQNEIWPRMRQDLGLKCAHYKVDGLFNGCLLDYLRPSKCPHK